MTVARGLLKTVKAAAAGSLLEMAEGARTGGLLEMAGVAKLDAYWRLLELDFYLRYLE